MTLHEVRIALTVEHSIIRSVSRPVSRAIWRRVKKYASFTSSPASRAETPAMRVIASTN